MQLTTTTTTSSTAAADHLFAACAPPLTLPLADTPSRRTDVVAAAPPPGDRRPAFLSREGARTAARIAVTPGLPLVPTHWQPRKAITAPAPATLRGEDGQAPPPAPRRFKVATPFPLAGYLEDPRHQRTVRRRSLGAMLVLAGAILAFGGAGPEARAQSSLSGSGLSVSFNNGSGGINALQYNGSEFYQLGTYLSDWGLQTGTNAGSFVLNTATGSIGQPMTLALATPSAVTFTGTYAAGGANVGLTRTYSLLPGSPVLRTTFTLHNLSGVSVDLREFETFDPDFSGGTFATANDRLLVGSALAGRAVRADGSTVILGSADPATIISASDRFGFAGGATEVNAFFANGGTDSNGASSDLTLDIGFSLPLGPGASRTVSFDQAYGSSAAAAQSAFLGAPVIVPEPSTWAMALGGLGVLVLLQKRRRTTVGAAAGRAGAWSLMAAAGLAWFAGAGQARAQLILTVEPDIYLSGTDITSGYPGVSLHVATDAGTITGNVYSVANPYVSTGTRSFGLNSSNATDWSLYPGSPVLRADFAIPTNYVSLDFIGNDSSDVGTLNAFNAAGTLLATLSTPVQGTNGIYNLTTSTPGIAYILAGGSAVTGDTMNMDNLRFGSVVPEPSTWALALGGLAGMAGVARCRPRQAARRA